MRTLRVLNNGPGTQCTDAVDAGLRQGAYERKRGARARVRPPAQCFHVMNLLLMGVNFKLNYTNLFKYLNVISICLD